MDSHKIYLTAVQANPTNPRTITDRKFQKLINSVLSLPQMLDLRPVVVDGNLVALGGNMRYRALCEIAKLNETQLLQRLDGIRDVKKKSAAEKKKLRNYWSDWLKQPTISVVEAACLTPDEQKEFIIKDNGDFGQWDYDVLANQWNADDLDDWGVDVWQNKEVENVYAAVQGECDGAPAQPQETPQDNTADALPPELLNADLTPDDIPQIAGSDERPCERIIITYKKGQADALAAKIGLEKITQVVYEFERLFGNSEHV